MGFLATRWTGDYGLWAGVCREPLSIAAGISAIATVASTIVGVAGAQAEGKSAQQAANYKAAQLQQQAQESRASSQRTALEDRHKADLVQSQLVARAAASGAGASDETVLKLGEEIAGRGEYQAGIDMYRGENAARGSEDAGKAAILSGEATKQGATFKSMGTIAGGIGSLANTFAKFNSPLPGGSSAATTPAKTGFYY